MTETATLFADPPPRFTAAEIATAVRRKYRCETAGTGMDVPEWAALEEFTLAPGIAGYKGPDVGSARIDLFLVRCWQSQPKGHERHAVEIKVTKADLRKELADPYKRAPFEAAAHRFWFAVPAGLCDGIEVPENIGIYEVTGNGVRTARGAARNDTPIEIPERTFVEAFRRASRAEARVRGADTDDLPARLVEADRNVERMRGQLRRAEKARDLHRDRWKVLVGLLAAAEGQVPCARCKGPLAPRRGRLGSVGWKHVGDPGPECSGIVTYPFPDYEAYLTDVLGLAPEESE